LDLRGRRMEKGARAASKFEPFTTYYYDDQIKENEMDMAYSMHRTDDKCTHKILLRKPE
jgi:hypothetical protein